MVSVIHERPGRASRPLSRGQDGARPKNWKRPLLQGAAAIIAGAVLSAGWSSWTWLRNPASLPVRSMVLQGELQKVAPAAVMAAVKPLAAPGFLWLDPDRISAALEKLPWVAQAEVRRVWPDQLQITITAQQPAARWLGGSGQLLNPQGQVFQVPAAQVPGALPGLFGPADSGPQLLGQLQEFDAVVQPLGLHVTDLEEDARGAWRCILSNGVRLLLGREAPLVSLQRWVAVAPQLQEYMVQGSTMDLRYTNGFAISPPTAAGSSTVVKGN